MSRAVQPARSLAPKAVARVQRTAATVCAVNSFSGDTPVLLADGSEKPINEVAAGDRVRAEDPQTGEARTEPVEQVIVGRGLKHMVAVTIAGETVEATYNHPFWVVEDQKFEWVEDLKPGAHLLLASGQVVPVLSLGRHDEEATVYNLSIQEIHTSFVGRTKALVHNSCGYSSFNRFKSKLGPAGPGMAWHHIVEQRSVNVQRFGASAIHNTRNLGRLPQRVHWKISAYYYSSIDRSISPNQTVRQWLSGQSFRAQYRFGRRIMRRYGH